MKNMFGVGDHFQVLKMLEGTGDIYIYIYVYIYGCAYFVYVMVK